MDKISFRYINGKKVCDYMDRFSVCAYHNNRLAIYYNFNKKWLCEDCLNEQLKRLKENEK